ncbi:MAG: hypothetical protein GY796_26050 [Chloroflexi bacterium]|nr:hypothetical protein [Chloroflexota bacterium]
MAKRPILVETGPAFATAALVHRVAKPKIPGPHPTVVMLHGHWGNEDAMWIFARTLPPDWLVVAPRAIVPIQEKSYTWHPRSENEWPTLTQFDDAVDIVTRFIHTLPELYEADLDQLYLMGFSQGAAVSFAIAIHHQGWIKGIASLVGFMPFAVEEAIEQAALRNSPVFMVAGKQDERIPLPIAQGCAEAVREMGAVLEYREYPTGHKLNRDGMQQLKSWWTDQALFQ